ncbi:PCNA-interacting partner-like [Crassostrea virginica]
MVSLEAPCFVFNSYDKEVISNHRKQIEEKVLDCASENGSSSDTSIKKITTIHSQEAVYEDAFSLSEYFTFLCRKYQLLPNERSTLLSSMDQLIALQLCWAEKNKEERGEFDIETSTVFESNKEIIKIKLQSGEDMKSSEISESYQKFLQHCNYVDTCDVFNLVQKALVDNEDLRNDLSRNRFLFFGLPTDPVEVAMIKLLCKGREIFKVSTEVSLEGNNEGNIEVCMEASSFDCLMSEKTKWRGISTPGPSQSTGSLNQLYVQLVYVAYLELLVNSRSELALARCFNVPERELELSAFTDLKHEAQKKNMSMYQTATSFIMKVRLGGKGYQPDSSLPITEHVKGLSDFITFTHKLQTIVEEEDNSRVACRRILNVLKKEISKSTDKRIQPSSVVEICEDLQKRSAQVIQNVQTNSPAKKPLTGGTPLGYKTLRTIHHLVDQLITDLRVLKANSLDVLCDSFSGQNTPIRFPCLLSQFRTPCEEVDSPELNKSLAERLLEKQRKETPLHAKRYKASMDWAAPAHDVQMTDEAESYKCPKSVYVLPSKTLVQPASASKRVALPGLKERTQLQSNEDNIDKESSDCLKEKTLSQESPQEEVVSSQDAENQLDAMGKGKKRPSEPCEREPKKKKTQPQGKTCRRKLLPQIKGQQQINRFFRV